MGRPSDISARPPREQDSVGECATVMYKAAWYCLKIGNAAESERLSLRALKARRKIMAIDHDKVLSATAMVAEAYRNQGRWEEAERLEEKVMETSKTKLGADHPSTLTSMANLAHTYWSQDQRLKAVDLLRG